MIRILHYGLSENFGGIEAYIKMLHDGMNKEKFRFDFLIFDGVIPEYCERFKKRGSKFYSVTSRRKNLFKNYIELREIMKKNKFDVLHCHMNTLSYITPVLAASSNQIPVVVQSHSSNADTNSLTKFLHGWNGGRLPKNNLLPIAVSDYAGKWLFKDDDFVVINNGIEVEEFKFHSEKRRKIREEFHVYKREYLIVHVGVFREVKNHEFILRSFAKFNKIVGNSRLLLVGEGETKETIQCLVKDLGLEERVVFAGSRNDVSDIHSGADLFIFPSLYEGFPLTVVEAQASGVDTLISDTITDEVVINDNCYPLSIHGETAEKKWVSKMLELHQGDLKQMDRSLAYKKIVARKLTNEDTIQAMERIYEQALNPFYVRESGL